MLLLQKCVCKLFHVKGLQLDPSFAQILLRVELTHIGGISPALEAWQFLHTVVIVRVVVVLLPLDGELLHFRSKLLYMWLIIMTFSKNLSSNELCKDSVVTTSSHKQVSVGESLQLIFN